MSIKVDPRGWVQMSTKVDNKVQSAAISRMCRQKWLTATSTIYSAPGKSDKVYFSIERVNTIRQDSERESYRVWELIVWGVLLPACSTTFYDDDDQ